MIDDLLNLADELAKRDQQVAKRKAISTAYYAAFHALCQLVADALIEENKESPLYSKVYRHIEHSTFDKQDAFNSSDGSSRTIIKVRDELRNLRQKREQSDYSPYIGNEKIDAHDAVDRARAVINLIRSIETKSRRELALNIVLGSSKKSRGLGTFRDAEIQPKKKA